MEMRVDVVDWNIFVMIVSKICPLTIGAGCGFQNNDIEK